MQDKEYILKIFDKTTGVFEKITVTEEVYNYYRRSSWREKKKDLYYRSHTYPFSSLSGGDNDAYENFHEFRSDDLNPEEMFIEFEMVNRVRTAFECLEQEEKLLLYEIYICRKTMREYSKNHNVPLMTAQYRKRKILDKMRKFLEN